MDEITSEVRRHYPMLFRSVNGRKILYFDSAATALKPDVVIKTLTDFYYNYDSNVFRGWHVPSAQATKLYEEARRIIAKNLGSTPENVAFCYNTTDGMQKIAYSLKIKKVALAIDLHHSSMLPFTRFDYSLIKIKEDGLPDFSDLKQKAADADAVVVNHVSNVTGTINDLSLIRDLVKDKILIVDGAQGFPHLSVNVEKWGVDAYVFSGHKVGGPYGSGAMYISPRLQQLLSPLGGGESIENVFLKGDKIEVKYQKFPHCFEPGTPSIANQIALASAIQFISVYKAGLEHRERKVLKPFFELASKYNIKYLGGSLEQRSSLIAFKLGAEVALKLAVLGVCSRYGYHCAEPLHHFLKSPPSLRFSIFLYNTEEEALQVATILENIIKGNSVKEVETIVYPEPEFYPPSAVVVDPCENCSVNCMDYRSAVLLCPFVPSFIKERLLSQRVEKMKQRRIEALVKLANKGYYPVPEPTKELIGRRRK